MIAASPQLLENELIAQGDAFRQGNPPKAKECYLHAVNLYKSVTAHLRLAKFYLDGLDIDGQKNEILAKQHHQSAINLIQKKYDEMSLLDPNVESIIEDIEQLLASHFVSSIEPNLIAYYQRVRTFILAIQARNKKDYQGAFDQLQLVVKEGYHPAMLEFAKANLNNFSGKGINLEEVFELCKVTFTHGYHAINGLATDKHARCACLESIEILFELRTSKQREIRGKAENYIHHYSYAITDTILYYINQDDVGLKRRAQELQIHFLAGISVKTSIQQLVSELIQQSKLLQQIQHDDNTKNILINKYGALIESTANKSEKELLAVHNSILCCTGQLLRQCHQQNGLNLLKSIANGSNKVFINQVVLAQFFIALYYFDNYQRCTAFIILQFILQEMVAGRINSFDADTIAQQLIDLANQMESKYHDRRLATRLFQLATEFHLLKGTIEQCKYYDITHPQNANDNILLPLLNKLGLALWLLPYPNSVTIDGLNKYPGIQSLFDGLILEYELQNPICADRSKKCVTVVDKYKLAHESGCILGTFKLAYVYQMNFTGTGVNVVESTALYKLFLASPLLHEDTGYKPAIAACIDQLLIVGLSNSGKIRDSALTILIDELPRFTDTQVTQLIEHTEPQVKFKAQKELFKRHNMVAQLSIRDMLDYCVHPEIDFRTTAQSLLLQYIQNCLSIIRDIAANSKNIRRGPALFIIGRVIQLGNLSAIQMVSLKSGKVWKNDNELALDYFISSIQEGCSEGLSCALKLLLDLLREPATSQLALSQLPIIINSIKSSDIIKKLNDPDSDKITLQKLILCKELKEYKADLELIIKNLPSSTSLVPSTYLQKGSPIHPSQSSAAHVDQLSHERQNAESEKVQQTNRLS